MNLINIACYHSWAGNKLRDLLENLTEEEYVKDLGPPFGNIRKLCEHVVIALEVCFIFVNTKLDSAREEISSKMSKLEKLSQKQLFERWNYLDNQLEKAIDDDKEGQVIVPHITKEPFSMGKTDFYLQYITHSIYHRGQIIWAMKKLGKSTITTDYLFYFAERDLW